MYLYQIASLLGLILAVLVGLLFAHLGLHGLPGIIASAGAGLLIAVLIAVLFGRKLYR